MTAGNYDHPTYLTRQMDTLNATTAGANGTSIVAAYPMDLRLRRFTSAILTAGTTAGAFAYAMTLNGTVTATLGTMTLGTSTANTVVQLPDVNTLLPTGAILFIKNGTDATSKVAVAIEMHGDPVTGTWTTP